MKLIRSIFLVLFIIFTIYVGKAYSSDKVEMIENENVIESESGSIDENNMIDEELVETKEEIVGNITKDEKESDKIIVENNNKRNEKNDIIPSTENKKSSTISTNSNVNTNSDKEEKKIWEKLGMTEFHYFNEPMYNWEHVDFSVDKYGSESKAKNACLEYGDKYEPYLNGEVSYNCSTVTSTSGKYLGEMFYTEKINQTFMVFLVL